MTYKSFKFLILTKVKMKSDSLYIKKKCVGAKKKKRNEPN